MPLAGGSRRNVRFLPALAFAAACAATQPALAGRPEAEDFDAMWRALDSGYAYFDRQRSAWQRARDAWRPRAVAASSRDELLVALEGALAELHDDHVTLSERSTRAPRRIPADIDIAARWKDGAATIEAVRTFGDADVAGLRAGQVVTRIQGIEIERAVRERLGRGTHDERARDWALAQLLAGPRAGPMRLDLRDAPRPVLVERSGAPLANGSPLLARRVGEERDIGYVRLKGQEANAALAAQLDAALAELGDVRALILDLRETAAPATRAATVAILGRFVAAPTPWQAREGRAGKRVTDTVTPRDPPPYRAPLVVLVDRWTAGEAEALAAGLQGAAHARILGTATAGLRGDLTELRLPHSGIVVAFPAERAFLVDGTPREALRPDVPVDLAAPSGGPGDPILYQALKLVK